MSPLGMVHFGAALASLALGAAVLLVNPKGTRRHRQLGWTYVASMLLLNVTALLIYRLFGRFGPFHVAAIISLVTLLLGVHAAVSARFSRGRRDAAARSNWVERHYYWMTYSYVGLVAAAIAETATRLPIARYVPGSAGTFGAVVAIASVVVFIVGAWLIRGNAESQLARFRHRTAESGSQPTAASVSRI